MLFGLFRRRDEVEVIDGDTVKRPDGRDGMEEFRLLGFDAPETSRGSDLERERGRKATDRLRQLLANARRVKLELGTSAEGNQMHHNRRFARLYIDGKDVSDIAIREGWGVRLGR